MYSAKVTPGKEYVPVLSIPLKDLGAKLPVYINVEYRLFDPGIAKNEAQLVCSVDKNDSSLAWQSRPVAQDPDQPGRWKKVNARFILPHGLTREPVIKIYLWNPAGSVFFIDDLNVKLD